MIDVSNLNFLYISSPFRTAVPLLYCPKDRIEERTVSLINLRTVNLLQVYLRRTLTVMAKSLTDVGHWHVLLLSRGRPGVSADVGGERQSQHVTQLSERLVIADECAHIGLVGVLGIASAVEDGQQIDGGRGMPVEDGLHLRRYLYGELLSCLMAAVGERAVAHIALAQVGHIDKGNATGTEAEHEEVADKQQAVGLLVESTTAGLPSLLTELRLQCLTDVKLGNTADVSHGNSPLTRPGYPSIGTGEGIARCQSVGDSTIPDGVKAAQVRGTGVARDAMQAEPVLKVFQELLREPSERYIFLAHRQ